MGNRAESQDLIDLGNRIRKRRQEIHLSQEVLAEKTGISPTRSAGLREDRQQCLLRYSGAGGDSENRCRNTIGGM